MSVKLKAAVIGSGLGGLAAAIRLQSSGYQTTIFEKRVQIFDLGLFFHQKEIKR